MNIRFFIRIRFLCLLLIFISFFFRPGFVQAHGSLEIDSQVVGNYTAFLAYSPMDLSVEWKKPTPFIFGLDDNRTKKPFAYTEVIVTILQDDKTLLTERIQYDANRTALLAYQFSHEGRYLVHANYKKNDITIAEATFKPIVFGSYTSATSSPTKPTAKVSNNLVIVISLITIGLAVGLYLLYKRIR